MKDESNNHSQASTEAERDAEDRLIDWGLRTGHAAESAPDLTDRILTASTEAEVQRDAAKAGDAMPTHDASKSVPFIHRWRRRAAWIAVAATLLLCVTGLLLN